MEQDRIIFDGDGSIGLVALSSAGTVAVASPEESSTLVEVFSPDGEPGVPDIKHRVPFEAAGMVSDGSDGFLLVGHRGETALVSFELKSLGPIPIRARELLMGAVRIDDRIFAFGMAGQIFERRKNWELISDGIDSSEHVSALAGNQSELFAVGSNSWRLRGMKWDLGGAGRRNYTDLVLDGDELIALSGNSLFRATRDGEWNEEQLSVPGELRALCMFDDTLYAASSRSVYAVTDDQPVPERLSAEPVHCGLLATNGDVLVSAGHRDLFGLSNGAWSRLA